MNITEIENLIEVGIGIAGDAVKTVSFFQLIGNVYDPETGTSTVQAAKIPGVRLIPDEFSIEEKQNNEILQSDRKVICFEKDFVYNGLAVNPKKGDWFDDNNQQWVIEDEMTEDPYGALITFQIRKQGDSPQGIVPPPTDTYFQGAIPWWDIALSRYVLNEVSYNNTTKNLEINGVPVGGGSGNIEDGTDQGQLNYWNATTSIWSPISKSDLFWDNTNKFLGIGIETPNRKFEVVDNFIPQLRLTNVDAVSYTDFEVDSGGDLNILPSSGEVYIPERLSIGTQSPSSDRLHIADTDILNTGLTYSFGSFKTIQPTSSSDASYFSILGFISVQTNNDLTAVSTNTTIGPAGIIGVFQKNNSEGTTQEATGIGGRLDVSRSEVNPIVDAAAIRAFPPYIYLGSVTRYSGLNIPESNMYTISDAYGIYQSGSNDKNYFAGNTGVNTYSPARKFEVVDDTDPQLRITNTLLTDYTDFEVDSNGNLNILPSGNTVFFPLGSATNPSISFFNNNTGFYQPAANKIGISLNGYQRFLFEQGYYLLGGSSSGAAITALSSNATKPVHLFTNDFDTGMGRAGADQLSLIAGGVEGIRITEASGEIQVDITDFLNIVNDTDPQLRLTNTLSVDYTDFEVDSDGNLSILPSGGEISYPGTFAEIYTHDNSTAQSIPTGATYTKLTAWSNNGESNNITADASNNKITITKPGRYSVVCSISGSSGTANVVFLASAFLGGVEQDQIHWKRKISTANDIGSMSMSGIIDVTTSSDLDIRARHDNAGSINFTVAYGNLKVEYLGET